MEPEGFPYKMDVVQEGEQGNGGEMIIIYNYNGAELTPELLAKTLEELSTQTSLDRSSLGREVYVDESGNIVQQNFEISGVGGAEAPVNDVMYALENQEVSAGDNYVDNGSSVMMLSSEEWGKPDLKLEVIAQDAISGATIASSGSIDSSFSHMTHPVSSFINSVDSDNIYFDPLSVDTVSKMTPPKDIAYSVDSSVATAGVENDINSSDNLVTVKEENKDIKEEKKAIAVEQVCSECDFSTFIDIELQRHMKTEHDHPSPFICNHCSKSFKLELTLDIHMFSHKIIEDPAKPDLKYIHKVKRFFSCPLCDFQYQRKPQLAAHMTAIHQGERYWFCKECNYSSLTEEELTSHRESTSHKEEHGTLCPLCGTTTKNLRQHVRTAHSDHRPFLCTMCGFKAKTTTNLKAHMETHNPVKHIECPECSYCCRSKEQLKRHSVRHISEKRFKCQLCKYACKTSMSLKRHMQIHQTPDRYVCNICNFKTHDKHLLKEHKQSAHLLKPRHKCRECPLEFERPLELRKHALFVHKSDKSQFCSYCEYSCNTQAELRTHMEQHFGKFSYVCSICGYSTRIKTSYNRHMNRHSKVKNFKCDLCDYASVEKYDLQKHMAHKHSEDKPFSCPFCLYTCKFKPRLDNHIAFVHSDEKPFFCKYCPYAGKSSESLKNHMLHHGILPPKSRVIQCVLCDYSTHERAKLRRHMKTHVNKAYIEIQTVQ